MAARLDGEVWEVSTKMQRGEIGGGLLFYISKRDARVLGIFLTQ
jgi:hypothetical protein